MHCKSLMWHLLAGSQESHKFIEQDETAFIHGQLHSTLSWLSLKREIYSNLFALVYLLGELISPTFIPNIHEDFHHLY